MWTNPSFPAATSTQHESTRESERVHHQVRPLVRLLWSGARHDGSYFGLVPFRFTLLEIQQIVQSLDKTARRRGHTVLHCLFSSRLADLHSKGTSRRLKVPSAPCSSPSEPCTCFCSPDHSRRWHDPTEESTPGLERPGKKTSISFLTKCK